jgi:hypothetical protein
LLNCIKHVSIEYSDTLLENANNFLKANL